MPMGQWRKHRILEAIMDWTSIGIAIIGSGALTALINWLMNREKATTDAAASNVDTAVKLRDEVIAERDDLRHRLEELNARMGDLERQLQSRAKEWEISQGVIRHQSMRIEELTRQLTSAEATIVQLESGLQTEKVRVTRLRNRIIEITGQDPEKDG